METLTRAGAFLKWAGGKQALAASLTARFPPAHSTRTYYEPFLGGGSVFFTHRPTTAVLSDSNRWLIQCYEALRSNWRRVGAELDKLKNTREDFLRLRSVDPETLPPFKRASLLIYLNKTCFRGLFRVNRQGRFNVPYGAYQRRYYDPINLRLVADCLHTVVLRTGDFESAVHDIGSDDFVYFDPPYYKAGGYADFNRYTPEQFKEHDHQRLAALCCDLNRRGVRWALSNSDTPFVRQLYRGFRVERLSARREIRLRAQGRGTTELLVTNY